MRKVFLFVFLFVVLAFAGCEKGISEVNCEVDSEVESEVEPEVEEETDSVDSDVEDDTEESEVENDSVDLDVEEETDSVESSTEDADTLASDTTAVDSVVTVSQFINCYFPGEIWVQGYIVGSCQRSHSNADFEAPFEGRTAILLADSIGEREEVIAIHLKTGLMRDRVNLEDNPQHYGRLFRVKGKQGRYLGFVGMNTENVTRDCEFVD